MAEMQLGNAELLRKLRSLRYGEKVMALANVGTVQRVDEHSLTVVVRVGNIEKPVPISEIGEY